MSPTRTLFVEAVAAWSGPADAPGIPAPASMSANERRRAPLAVRLALHVAEAAVAQSGRTADTLASVFTSAHGDLQVVDALCGTLAANPLLLSPTRFHHSVHNAASGYWAIAADCRLPSLALAGPPGASFGAGFLEAASQCADTGEPVLLVGCDTEASGPLASVNTSRGLLALALVLAAEPGPNTLRTLAWCLHAGTVLEPRTPQGPETPQTPQTPQTPCNAMADALPLLAALRDDAPSLLRLAVSPSMHAVLTIGLRSRAGPPDDRP